LGPTGDLRGSKRKRVYGTGNDAARGVGGGGGEEITRDPEEENLPSKKGEARRKSTKYTRARVSPRRKSPRFSEGR